jgi:hypothetical protein
VVPVDHKKRKEESKGIDTRGMAAAKSPPNRGLNPLESSQSPSVPPLGRQGDPHGVSMGRKGLPVPGGHGVSELGAGKLCVREARRREGGNNISSTATTILAAGLHHAQQVHRGKRKGRWYGSADPRSWE